MDKKVRLFRYLKQKVTVALPKIPAINLSSSIDRGGGVTAFLPSTLPAYFAYCDISLFCLTNCWANQTPRIFCST